jgi:hypothetical protein
MRDAELKDAVRTIAEQVVNGTNDIRFELDKEDWSHKVTAYLTGPITARLVFNASREAVNISDFAVVEQSNRRSGRCRLFLQNMYRELSSEHWKKIELRAVNDGIVVWPALGFHPTIEEWPKRRAILSSLLDTPAQEFRGEPWDGFRKEISTEDDPTVLARIASLPGLLDTPLSPRELGVRLIRSLGEWDGELIVGDIVDERHLFG